MSNLDLSVLYKCIEDKNHNLLELLCISLISNNSLCDNNAEFKNIYEEYVLKQKKCIRILLCCDWSSSKSVCDLWNKMSKGNYTWNNIKIVWEEPCDYYCIINSPPVDFKHDPSKTILFRMEPNVGRGASKWEKEWLSPDKNTFLFHSYNDLHYSNVEWHLSKTYTELLTEKIKKDKDVYHILSTVLSDKYADPGHHKRVDFVKFLESKGLPVDVYGGNRFLWKNYKGSLPSHKKDNALFPYKYTFNCENHSIKNYCTEKLYDGILAECLTFYHGCINYKDFIDERAFVYLDLINFEHDYNIIRKAIDEDLWNQRLPYIKAVKTKILEEMQFFPRIEKIVSS